MSSSVASVATPAAGASTLSAARASLLLMAVFAATRLALQLWVGEGYGWFRDEFYYVACSDHLAWGYVDQPPLSIAVLKAWRLVFGDSLLVIRMLAALVAASAIVTTGWMARALGGGLFAQALAMAAALAAPQYLGGSNAYSMNVFDLLLWSLAAAVLIRIFTEGGTTRRWIAFGVVVGLGLLNKWSMMWFAGGAVLGMLLTPQRRHLATPGPWLAGLIAGLLFLPHVLWEIGNGWPTLEFIRNATGGKMRAVGPLDFARGQVISMNPLALPVWLAGLVLLLREARVRALGLAFLAVAALLVLNGTSRTGYLAPAYTMLFAAGGVALARTLLPARRPLLRGVALGLLLAGGAVLAPFALPILPVDTYVAYAARLGIGPSTEERNTLGRLPQHFADMQGWDAIVAEVARVYHALPPADRARASIFTYNYGDAGAIDVLGRRYGLPHAISGHNNYWLWGVRGGSADVVIVIGGDREGHLRVFESAEPAGVTDCGDCMPYENHRTIWVLRGPRMPVDELWSQVRHYE